MTTVPYLQISNVTHGYAARTVIDDISFNAHPGEVICLLGRSGCGKTTLLRLIAGLEAPRAGCIAVNGRTLTAPSTFVPPDKRSVGMMFQDYALFPHLTALQNAEFGHRSGGESGAMALLTRVGLAQAAHQYPHTLSAGEQQRVALVRALVSQPSVLLMDEPFSNLDAGTRDHVRRMTLTLLRETQTTTVIVTHDPAEAMMLADRIVLLHEGRIEQIGTPTELYRAPRTLFAARYFSELSELNDEAAAYIRPHDVAIVSPTTGHPYRVADIAYTGEATLLTLTSANGASLKASARGALALKIGDAVGVTYVPQDLLVFPQSNPTAAGR